LSVGSENIEATPLQESTELQQQRSKALLIGSVVALTALGGALAFAYFGRTAFDTSSGALINMTFFAALTAVAGLFPLPVTSRIKTTITTAPLFACALVLPAGNAVLAAVVGSMVYQVGLRWRPERLVLPIYKYPFNVGEVILSTGLAAWTFQALGGDIRTSLWPTVPAAAVMYMTNTGLVSIVASISAGYSLPRLWWMGTQANGLAEIALYSFGVLGAFAFNHSPLFSFLSLGIPVWTIYLAFSGLASANAQLEKALGDLRDIQGRMISTSKLASVGALSLDLAHQVRNPLFVVIARLERLQERIDPEHALRPEVDRALDGAHRIQQLTDNLLAMARLQWVPIDVGMLIEDAISMAPVNVTQRSPVIRTLPESLPQVQGNPVLLREALSNLVVNALEASPYGDPVNVRALTQNGSVLIEVQDAGVGIPPDRLAHLFEPFQTTKNHGLGLGLFSAKHIVNMHGGDLDVQSQSGKGTTVTVQLPVAVPSA
jgi:signal transduction histidine kinase